MTWKQAALRAAHRAGTLRAAGAAYTPSLTVLAYHRVIEFAHPGFGSLRRNVSATPDEFRTQMEHAATRFEPVSFERVAAFVAGRADLPRRALLVTFDDGYRDNLTGALPIMQEHGIVPTVFLATDHIGTGRPFGWDAAAWCFEFTRVQEADLPVLGPIHWETAAERDRVAGEWVEAIKALPDADRNGAMSDLPGLLEVELSDDAFADVYLSWDEVREMTASGVAVGGHTRRHPILTRVPGETARAEIEGCRDRIREELGTPPIGFAYPNGGPGDYDAATMALLADAGFELAFSLLWGPARQREVTAAPLDIRRVYIHHGDHAARFTAKVHGIPRLVGWGR